MTAIKPNRIVLQRHFAADGAGVTRRGDFFPCEAHAQAMTQDLCRSRADRRGVPVTVTSDDALAALDDAIDAYSGYRTDAGAHLKRALALDADCPFALTLRACFLLFYARRDFAAKAMDLLHTADRLFEVRGGSGREMQHLAAATAWARGDLAGALPHWQEILYQHPRDLLALKLAEYALFYAGDPRAMRAMVAQVIPFWAGTVPGAGRVQGMLAFALEECGAYSSAERIGRQAVERDPDDVWAVHAVAHVYEMRGLHEDGAQWLDGLAPHLAAVNPFRFHVHWHRALFDLAAGQPAAALTRYDDAVRPESTEEYLDIANAVALLTRLELGGADGGARWAELATQAAARLGDQILPFADLHYHIALARTGHPAEAALIEAAERHAAGSGDYAGRVLRATALDLHRAIAGFFKGDWRASLDAFLAARPDLWRIGGSIAQRDLFVQLMITAAERGGAEEIATMLQAERRHVYPGTAPLERGLREYGVG